MQLGGFEFFINLNKQLKDKLSPLENVLFIDPNDYWIMPNSQKEMYYYNNNSINHYSLKTYYEMARRIERLTHGTAKASRIALLIKKLYRKYEL